MQITIKILQAEYRDGFVFTKIAVPAAAVRPVDVRNVAELDAEVKALRAAWDGHIDGQILLGMPIGRKVAGFDAFKSSYSRDVRAMATAERAA